MLHMSITFSEVFDMENGPTASNKSIDRANSFEQSLANAIEGGFGLAMTCWFYGAIGGLVLASMLHRLPDGVGDIEPDN